MDINRREFLRRLGITAGSAAAMAALEPFSALAGTTSSHQSPGTTPDQAVRMTYRVQRGTGEQISLLGFGMMRLPRDNQELVNRLVDYAIAHGVNYFDTAPMYGGGLNEGITGTALSRHPREKYYVATKMSNYNERLWNLDEAKKMYQNSFSELRVDYIDYYLLHGVGQGGMENLNSRFIDNGLLDFLVAEREAGRIRHLGFSYHGDVRVFDWLIDHNDKYHWDFVQIQMNFLDWRHASLNKEGWKQDADAEYLYDKLEKAGIQVVVMEPLRGGALANMPDEYAQQLRDMRPDAPARRVGVPLGGLPSQHPHHAERNEPDGTPRAERAHPFTARPVYRCRECPARENRRRHGRHPRHPLHRLCLLYAVPLRRGHPGQLQLL